MESTACKIHHKMAVSNFYKIPLKMTVSLQDTPQNDSKHCLKDA